MLVLGVMLLSCSKEAETGTGNGQTVTPPGTGENGEPAHLTVDLSNAPKMSDNETNTLLDFMFCADPTATVYEGRLYVYGTNDHQQYQASDKNDYGKIKSLVMISTADMVNWTYHGTIDVGKIAPWITNSWAPSVVHKKGADGKEKFFLYFSNSGGGTAVLTASAPTGPWSDPLGHNLVDSSKGNLDNGIMPFDPGAVIDDNGTGWFSFGGGKSLNGGTEYMPLSSRIVKLNEDMLSFSSDFTVLKAPSFNEASELNYINGTWVYTYCNLWNINETWPEGENKPGVCSMCYMTSSNPLDTDSWTYRGDYFLNPGESVSTWGNNHSHLQKFRDKYYIFYHTQSLQPYFGVDGGFRNIAVDEINVDEQTVTIEKTKASRKGVSQIQNVNPFLSQEAETVSATCNAKFVQEESTGKIFVMCDKANACIRLSGADFTKSPVAFQALVSGKGGIDVRIDGPEGPRIAFLRFNNETISTVTSGISTDVNGIHDIYFVIKGVNVKFDSWKFVS